MLRCALLQCVCCCLQMVLAAYKQNRVPLSFALSALLPVLDVSCPQLAVVAPLQGLSCLPGAETEQAVPSSAVELVLRLTKLHASVGCVPSCFHQLPAACCLRASCLLSFGLAGLTPAQSSSVLMTAAASVSCSLGPSWLQVQHQLLQQLAAAG